MMTGAGRREGVGDMYWEAGRGWGRVLGGGKGLGTGAGRREEVFFYIFCSSDPPYFRKNGIYDNLLYIPFFLKYGGSDEQNI